MLPDSHRRHTFSNSVPAIQARTTVINPPSLNNATFPPSRPRSPPLASRQLPAYIKPLPARIGADEVAHLAKKGALTIPPVALRDALLQSYIEFLHPFMPIFDIQDLVHSVNCTSGQGQISLLVFQAIMFSGVASVDVKFLQAAGYATRREARRDFFQRTRVSMQ